MSPHTLAQACHHLREQGYAVIENFLSRRQTRAGLQGILQYFPTAQQLAAAPLRYEALLEQPMYLQVEFPFIPDALNDLATLPQAFALARHLLSDEQPLLTQAAIWAKYPGTDVYGSDLHVDYEGNTLVVPREDGDYRQLNLIIYLTDITLERGPTYVVPTPHTAHDPLWPPHRPRQQYPAMYRHELPILCPAGSAFIFSMSTFHRASPVLDPQHARYSFHMVIRSRRHPFAGHHLWSKHGEKPHLQQFITRARVAQRSALGFPPPGDPYWNRQTLARVARRYPGMDMKPYRQACKQP